MKKISKNLPELEVVVNSSFNGQLQVRIAQFRLKSFAEAAGIRVRCVFKPISETDCVRVGLILLLVSGV